MMQLLKNRWVQLVSVAVIMALVGAVVALLAFSSEEQAVLVTTGDRVMLTSPLETGDAMGGRGAVGAASDAAKNVFAEDLPLTASAAVSAGWKDPILCDAGRGRLFRKAVEQDVPYFLMYNFADELLGLYLYNMTEIPEAPWVKRDELRAAGLPIIEEEHWAMLVYFQDPITACASLEGSCGFNIYCENAGGSGGAFPSDDRLKRNQSTVPYGLEAVMELEPKIYDKYDGALHDGELTLDENSGRTELGLIAQDALGVIPEIVAVPDDPENGFYGVAYEQLTPVLIKSIQELKAVIDALRAEIEVLKK